MNKECNSTKECRKCHEIKELEYFYYRAGALDKRDSHCRACNNKRNMKWATDNSEKSNLIHKKYKTKNRYKYNEIGKEFVRKHKFRRVAWNSNVLAKRKSTGEKITAQQLWSLAKKQKLRCAISGVKLTNDNMSPDHIVPFAKGGKNVIENIQLVDKTINFMKSSISQEDFLNLIKTIYLHNFK